MNDRDQKLLQEAYDEVLLNEFNFKKAATTAGLAAASILPTTGKAQQAVQPQQPAITQAATSNQTQQPQIISFTTQQDLSKNSEDYEHRMNTIEDSPQLKVFYNYIMNSRKPFTITKQLLITSLYKPEVAMIALTSLSQQEKNKKITIYGVNAMKDIFSNPGYYMNAMQGAEKFALAFTTQTGTVYFTQNAKNTPPNELIQAVVHELRHATQFANQGVRPMAGSRPENTPIAHFNPRSPFHTNHGGAGGRQYDADDLSPNELEAYVVGGRDYWGIPTDEEFENKWNNLERIYNTYKNPNDFMKTAKLPEQVKRQFALYKTQMLDKANQEAYKRAIKNAAMNPKNVNLTNKSKDRIA